MRLVLLLCIPFIFGFTMPRGTQLELIGEGFVQNGMLMDIHHYKHRDEPSTLAPVVLELLGREPGEVITHYLQEDVLSIGLLQEKEYLTVTIQSDSDGRGSEGFITRTNLSPKKIPNPPLDINRSFKLISYTSDPSSKETWVFNSKRDGFWVTNELKRLKLIKTFTNNDGTTIYEGKKGLSAFQVVLTSGLDGTNIVIIE